MPRDRPFRFYIFSFLTCVEPTISGRRPLESPAVHLLEYGAVTDRGTTRDVNEDSILAAPPVFVVADGVGGAVPQAAGVRARSAARLRGVPGRHPFAWFFGRV